MLHGRNSVLQPRANVLYAATRRFVPCSLPTAPIHTRLQHPAQLSGGRSHALRLFFSGLYLSAEVSAYGQVRLRYTKSVGFILHVLQA